MINLNGSYKSLLVDYRWILCLKVTCVFSFFLRFRMVFDPSAGVQDRRVLGDRSVTISTISFLDSNIFCCDI